MQTVNQEIFVTPREQHSNFGLAVWHSRPRYMEECHHHNDIEVNCLDAGEFTYLLGGDVVKVRAGDIAVFWAARPHQVVEVTEDAFFRGLSVPLGWFLDWQLPEDFAQRIMGGEILLPPPEEPVTSIRPLLDRWLDDLISDTAEHRKIMLLEMEAWLGRVAFSVRRPEGHEEPPREIVSPPHSGLRKVEEIARFISEHYEEPLSTRDIAKAVGLHPNYAVNLFHQKTGSTLIDFLTRQRLAHAQLLLATTDKKVLSVALEAGFGSASRFYAVFKDTLHMSPNEYRKSIQAPRI